MIGLSQERLKEAFDYDPITGHFIWKIGHLKGRRAGCIDNSKGYVIITLSGYHYYGHVLAWFYIHGEWKRIDHKDTHGSNNAILNLRPATTKQNNRNQSIRIDNMLGVKGVTRSGNKFVARIFVDGSRIYLGTFKTIEEATNARQAAAQEYFGEFVHEDERATEEEAK
ncbi:MAG: HNH endonuclease [Candidatus Hydrogenedentales bacterium]